MNHAVDRQRALAGLEEQLVDVEIVVFGRERAGQLLDGQVRRLAAEIELLQRDAVVHGGVGERGFQVERVNPRGYPVGRRWRAIVYRQAAIDNLDIRQRDRLARALPIGFLRLPLDQPPEIPAAGIAPQQHVRLVDANLFDRHALRHQLRETVLDLHLLQRQDVLAIYGDRHIAELDAVEQVPAKAPDRHGAIHVLSRLSDDVLAQPVAEPRRLRHDQRQRDDADEERADQRHDLQRAPHVSVRRGESTLQHQMSVTSLQFAVCS